VFGLEVEGWGMYADLSCMSLLYVSFLLMAHSCKMNFTTQLNNVTKDRTSPFKNDNYMLFPLFLRHGWGGVCRCFLDFSMACAPLYRKDLSVVADQP